MDISRDSPSRWKTWKTSSFSGEGASGECVEVAPWGEVRDSKNRNGPTLKVNLQSFINAVKKVDQG